MTKQGLDELQKEIDEKIFECWEAEAKVRPLRKELQRLINKSDALHDQEQHRMMDVVVP